MMQLLKDILLVAAAIPKGFRLASGERVQVLQVTYLKSYVLRVIVIQWVPYFSALSLLMKQL